MIEVQVKLNSTDAAIDLVDKISLLKAHADFACDRLYVDAKSILGVLQADFSKPCRLLILADEITGEITDFLNTIKKDTISVEVKK